MRIRVGRLLSVAVAALAPVIVVAGVNTTAAMASACPNEQLRQESRLNGVTGVRYSAELPDCRAFEMVSPVEKEQGNIGFIETSSRILKQASSDGKGMLFNAVDPLPGNPSGPLYSQYRSLRSSSGWSTVPVDAAQLLVESEGSPVDTFLYFSPTLSCGFDESQEALAELPSGENVGEVRNLYVWNAATGSRGLVSNSNPLNRLNLEGIVFLAFSIQWSNANCSRLIFSTEYQLLAGVPAAKPSLYEWNEGTLSLVSKLPDGTSVPVTKITSQSSVVGPVGEEGQVAFSALSDTSSGSPGEIDKGKEEVFIRENGASTVEASKSQTSTPDSGATYQMGFGDGSPEGFQLLFTASHGITSQSSPAGTDLYDYNVKAKTLTDLTVDTNVSDTEGAGVFGVFGAGAGTEGAYVYFSASGQLVPGKGNTQAVNKSATDANIYAYHAGHVEYIATIPQGGGGQSGDLIASQSYSSRYLARVTNFGKSLLFMDAGNEIAAVTDNGFNNDNPSGEPQAEFYLYSAQTGTTVCASCNPTGGRPVGTVNVSTYSYGIDNGYTVRLLSESGERVFFTSSDELTPRAVAAGAKLNAYEWEREGIDESCPVLEHPASSGGCVFLLATASNVMDASPGGTDVFVETPVPLVAQDLDGVADVYDIRVDGGFPAPVKSECAGEACQGALNEPLVLPAAGSTKSPVVANALGQTETKVTEAIKPRPKALSRAQRLAIALHACRKGPKRKRAVCESRARRKYGVKAKRRAKTKRMGSSNKGGK